MPLSKRIIGKRSLYASPDIYRLVDKPEYKLQGISQMSMTGMLVQLSYLAAYAHELFGDIMVQANANNVRLRNLRQQLQATRARFAAADGAFKSTSHADHMGNAGVKYENSVETAYGLFTKPSRSQATNDVWLKAYPPPNLNLMTPYADNGKSCLKEYTNPDWFYEEWVRAQDEARDRMQKERDDRRKAKKEGKKGGKGEAEAGGSSKKDKKPKSLEKKQFAAHGPELENMKAQQGLTRKNTQNAMTKQSSSPILTTAVSPQDAGALSPSASSASVFDLSNAPPPPPSQDFMPPPPAGFPSFAPPPGPPPDLLFDIPPPPPSMDIDFGAPPPDMFAPPPLPPMASSSSLPVSSSSSSHRGGGGGGGPALGGPPPPPAPAPPPPPPAGAPAPMARLGGAAPRTDLMSSIQGGTTLKKTEEQPKKVATDPRSQLLQSISSGKNLKSASERALPEKKKTEDKGASNVGQILARAFEIRQAVAESDSDDDGDSDWDD